MDGRSLRQIGLIAKGNFPHQAPYPTNYPTGRQAQAVRARIADDDAFAAIAAAIARRQAPCPWNPFPTNSTWGRRVDEAYRRDQAVDEIARRIYPRRASAPSLVREG